MTNAERLAMIRAAHRRTLRANRYADHVALTARDDHDVPCVIGTAPVELAPVTVATREPWSVR
jgi:hypothetical protein